MSKLINFEHVKAHANFETILQHYNLQYQKKTDALSVHCPFHPNDTDPSCKVTLVETAHAKPNTFHCFGCSASGSVLDFVSYLEDNCELRIAAKIVDEICGCGLAAPSGASGKRRKGTRSPQSGAEGHSGVSTDQGAQNAGKGSYGRSVGVLKGNPPLGFSFAAKLQVSEYLSDRLDPDTAERFGVGYLPETSRSMMAGRICIPLHDETGVLVGYAGRYPADEAPDGVEKYLFPKGFSKSQLLFGLHGLQHDGAVVLVEGFFAAMWLQRLNIPAVAMMGTSISEHQVGLLRQAGVRNVLVLLDGDEPGRTALPRLLPALTGSFFVTHRELPDGTDPDTVDVDLLFRLVAMVR